MLFSLLVGGSSARVQAASGTEGASFLNIPVGAGPAALGAGYSALATDAYAPTFNAAGLGWIDDNEVAGQHVSYLESIHYEYLSFVHPLGRNRGVGGSIQYLGSGDIAATDPQGNSIGEFSSHYAAYDVAYGQMLTSRLSVGAAAKWINASIDDVGANAFAADFGALYHLAPKLSLATTLTNLGSSLKFLSQNDPLPLAVHFGAAYFIHPQMTLNGEAEYRRTGLAAWHMGAEWRPIPAVALRAGYRTDTTAGLSPLAGFTTGIALKYRGQEFSYAWLPYGQLGDTQYFSLVFRFGGVPERKRNLIRLRETLPEAEAGRDDAEFREVGKMIAEPQSTHAASRNDSMLQELLDGPQKRPVAQGHSSSSTE